MPSIVIRDYKALSYFPAQFSLIPIELGITNLLPD
jgi:hypothetical protein